MNERQNSQEPRLLCLGNALLEGINILGNTSERVAVVLVVHILRTLGTE